MLSFDEIKQIRIVDVVGRYRISLTTKGSWANGVCKLPTHKPNDKGKNFSVNLAGNFWRCFSQSCNEANGGKRGGDVISFVALMENCSAKDAAQKLSDWFHLEPPPRNAQNKTAPRIEKPSSVSPRGNQPANNYPEHSSSDSEVKPLRYFEEIDRWLDETLKRREKEVDCDYWKRVRKEIKSKLHQSYLAGKSQKAA